MQEMLQNVAGEDKIGSILDKEVSAGIVRCRTPNGRGQ